MTTTPSARKMSALMKKIGGAAAAPTKPAADDPVAVLLMSFLLWEATTAEAEPAYGRLTEQIVDYNDLRVCMPGEIVSFIGERYPQASTRAQRLRATLRDIYLREHDITLERVSKVGKREVKKYVESLDGIVPYVANRIMLICHDSQVIPVDERLRRCLIGADVCDEETDIGPLSTWLAKQVKPSAVRQLHADLQAWSDETGSRSTPRKKSAGRKAPAKTTPRKKTSVPERSTAAKGAASSSRSRPAASKKKTTTKKTTGRKR